MVVRITGATIPAPAGNHHRISLPLPVFLCHERGPTKSNRDNTEHGRVFYWRGAHRLFSGRFMEGPDARIGAHWDHEPFPASGRARLRRALTSPASGDSRARRSLALPIGDGYTGNSQASTWKSTKPEFAYEVVSLKGMGDSRADRELPFRARAQTVWMGLGTLEECEAVVVAWQPPALLR